VTISVITGETKLEIQYVAMPKAPLLNDISLEGPFFSEDHMKSASVIHSLITLRQSLIASKIALKEIKRRYPTFFRCFFSNDFIELLPTILEHSVIGTVKGRNLVTGMHLSHSGLKLKTNNKKIGSLGVFRNTPIIVLNSTRIEKQRPSTFWPGSWNITRFIVECAAAWQSRQSVTPEIQQGITTSGIRANFCFKDGHFKTVYPIN
jgi:hypothetical protein